MEERRKVLFGGINLLLAILLILLAIFLYTGLSTGWFASNKEVTATGMSAKIQGIHLSEIQIVDTKVTRSTKPNPSTNGRATKDSLLPGDVITVTAEFTVLEDAADQTKKIPVEFFLRTPPDKPASGDRPEVLSDQPVTFTAAEAAAVPQTEEGSYYLSTQIYVDNAALQVKEGNQFKLISQLLQTTKTTKADQKAWLSKHQLVWKQPMPKQPEVLLGKIADPAVPRSTQAGNQIYELAPGTYRIVLKLVFENSDTENQSPLRGNYVGVPAGQAVIPSSFWREIVVNEIY